RREVGKPPLPLDATATGKAPELFERPDRSNIRDLIRREFQHRHLAVDNLALDVAFELGIQLAQAALERFDLLFRGKRRHRLLPWVEQVGDRLEAARL